MLCQGLKNLRDFGGTKLPDGSLIKKGLIFRSGDLSALSSQGAAYLKDTLKVSTIIDLRTDTERSEKPDIPVPGVEFIHIPVFEESVIGITKETGADLGKYIKKTWNRGKIRASLPDMKAIYSNALADKAVVERLSRAISIVMDNAIQGKTTLFHCSQGKDRTGAMAALILTACGVSRDDVFDDYILGGKVYRRKAMTDALKVLLFKFDIKAAGIIYNAHQAKKQFIQAAYETIDRQYESEKQFIGNGLHLSEELVDRFKSAIRR